MPKMLKSKTKIKNKASVAAWAQTFYFQVISGNFLWIRSDSGKIRFKFKQFNLNKKISFLQKSKTENQKSKKIIWKSGAAEEDACAKRATKIRFLATIVSENWKTKIKLFTTASPICVSSIAHASQYFQDFHSHLWRVSPKIQAWFQALSAPFLHIKGTIKMSIILYTLITWSLGILGPPRTRTHAHTHG